MFSRQHHYQQLQQQRQHQQRHHVQSHRSRGQGPGPPFSLNRRRSISRLAAGVIHALNDMPSRPLVLAALFLLVNLLGHFFPLLWSASDRPPLLCPWLRFPPATTSSSSGLQGRGARISSQKRSARAVLFEGMDEGRAGENDPWGDEVREEEAGDRITPYVAYRRVAVGQAAVCQGLVPTATLQNVNRKPINSLEDLEDEGRRVLVFMARYGLGNSLRGYVSAYAYAKISGRTLVRFHGAEHYKVYDILCLAFKCGFDAIRWDNKTSPMALYRRIEELNPAPIYRTSEEVRNSLKDGFPLVLSKMPHFFDGFYGFYPRVKACVFAALGCSSKWCVHSRALHELLRGPTPLLHNAIASILHKHGEEGLVLEKREADKEGLWGSWGAGLHGAGVFSGRKERSKVRGIGIDEMFDVAVHMRTRAAAIENEEAGDTDAALFRVGCKDDASDLASSNSSGGGNRTEHEFLKGCLWECLTKLIKELGRDKLVRSSGSRPGPDSSSKWKSGGGGSAEAGTGRLSILLTTDNEALRPVFVERLAPLGDVYYSSGSIVHLSKSASADMERLPTMAEFYLMAKSHTIIEAGSYVSTFAYFAGLYGNGTLASIDWSKEAGGCGFTFSHKGEPQRTSWGEP